MYDNIASLRFVKGSNNETLATAMVSAEGEVMEFRTHIPAEGRVEDWMTSVLEEMRTTNRLITKEAVFYYCENTSRLVSGSRFFQTQDILQTCPFSHACYFLRGRNSPVNKLPQKLDISVFYAIGKTPMKIH